MEELKPAYDVVIIGAGHNALVSAAYLAQTGLSVLVLEKQTRIGGASISAKLFPGVDAYPSQYSYLVSLLPDSILSDLSLSFETKSRSIASYTPVGESALLIANDDEDLTQESFAESLSEADRAGYAKLLELESVFAKKIWPTMLEKLVSKEEMKARFTSPLEAEAWDAFVERPLGETLERHITDDALRGLVFTDAKIGVLTYPDDPSLLQNRTFLYHIIGNGTGEWRIPVGGMGALTTELERAARTYGAVIRTSATVTKLEPDKHDVSVAFSEQGVWRSVRGKYILCGATPSVLSDLLGEARKPADTGAVFKINMLLTRLPKLKSSAYSSEQAFTGTFHVNEGYEAMKQSAKNATEGKMPSIFPGEMYCHTLTDPSILSPELRSKGYQTLTFFGLDTPYSLFVEDNESTKKVVLEGYLNSINTNLAEPIQDCIAKDANGNPCIEARSPVDLERDLGMTEGNIFHGSLSWPFDDAAAGTWGVETEHERILLCGAGALRGGGVSGIPGHNAAMAVLEKLKLR